MSLPSGSFRARVLGVYGQGLFHGQPLTPETVSPVPSSDGMLRDTSLL